MGQKASNLSCREPECVEKENRGADDNDDKTEPGFSPEEVKKRLIKPMHGQPFDPKEIMRPVGNEKRQSEITVKLVLSKLVSEEPISCVAIGTKSEGRQKNQIAMGDDSGRVLTLDVKSLELREMPALHRGATLSLDYTPDGALLTSGEDGLVRLWGRDPRDVPGETDETAMRPALGSWSLEGSGATRSTMDGATGCWVEHVAASPVAPIFAAAVGRTIHIMTFEGRLVTKMEVDKNVGEIRFLYDGTLCALVCGGILLYEYERINRQVLTFSPEPEPLLYNSSWFTAFNPSPTGVWLAAGCHDNSCPLWRVRNAAAEIDPRKGRDNWVGAEGLQVTCAGGAFGKRVTSCSWDSTGRYVGVAGGAAASVWDVTASQRSGPAGSCPFSIIHKQRDGIVLDMAWCQAFGDGAARFAIVTARGFVKFYDVSVFKKGNVGIEVPHRVPSSNIFYDLCEKHPNGIDGASICWLTEDRVSVIYSDAETGAGHIAVLAFSASP